MAKLATHPKHKKHKKHKIRVLSLEKNNFQITPYHQSVQPNQKENLLLSELPQFTFLAQNEKQEEPKNSEKDSENPSNKSQEQSSNDEKVEEKSPKSEAIIKPVVVAPQPETSSFEDLLVFDIFSKNEDKCEVYTAKTFCINSDQVVPSNSYNASLKRVKHLIKSKNQAIHKLSADFSEKEFNSVHRNTILEVNTSSNLLFDRSKFSYLIEHKCESHFGANEQWDQSLLIVPYQKFIEILPTGTIFRNTRIPGNWIP